MITQEELKKVLHYNKDSGVFVWIIKPCKNISINSVAGTLVNGYIYIRLNKKRYAVHRLAWLYEYGVMPSKHLDHINRIKSDNRIANLRDVSHSENHKNMPKQSNNTSGVVGVKWDKSRNRWSAYIKVEQKNIFLGRYVEFSEAVNARKNAEILYGFHENHGKDI